MIKISNLFRFAVIDNDFKNGYSRTIWDKTTRYTNYAFVVYDKNNKYIDSIDPIEKIFKIGDRIFVENDASIFEENISVLQDYVCRVEAAHYNYENNDDNYIDIRI